VTTFRLSLGVSALSILMCQSVLAQVPPVQPPSIPDPLKQTMLMWGGDKATYIAQVKQQIRAYSRDKKGIDAADVTEMEAVAAAGARAQRIAQILAYDLNGDTVVTRDEIARGVRKRMAGLSEPRQEDMVRQALVQDGNGDGRIELQEIRDNGGQPGINQDLFGSRLRQLLDLDPNKDGRVTVEEAADLAEGAWATVDADGDGRLSQDEMNVLRGNRGRFNTMAAAPQAPMVAAPQAAMAGGLRLTTEAGANADAGFALDGSKGASVSPERKFVAVLSGGSVSEQLKVALEQGQHFEVAGEACGPVENGTKRCEIKVRMKASYNGIFKDKLSVGAGQAKAELALTGQAQGWPEANLVWDKPVKDSTRVSITETKHGETFVINGKGTGAISEPQTFQVRNIGQGPSAPLELVVTDFSGSKKDSWRIDPASTCLKRGLEPGATCTVTVRAAPTMDGELAGTIYLPGGKYRHEEGKMLGLHGIAKGIAGKLPDGVRGNGDACPKPGQKAEVAVSGTGGFRSNDGYFANANPHGFGKDQSYVVATAECDAWQLSQDGRMACNNPGEGAHSSTMRRYQAQSIDGPWTPTELKARHISARLTCKSGVIESITWTW